MNKFLPEKSEKKREEQKQDRSEQFAAEKISACVFALKKKLKRCDPDVVDRAARLLTDIVLDPSFDKWRCHIDALENYVDWVCRHSINVALISLMIAEEIGIKEADLKHLGIGALLHDIGKILIPEKIIQKPGRLEKSEFSLVQQHCDLGIKCVENASLPAECAEIIMQHHERMDGSGYPNGLIGKEISLLSQIVMVADAVDAITSSRPYKKPQGIHEALSILKSEGEKYPLMIVYVLESIVEISAQKQTQTCRW